MPRSRLRSSRPLTTALIRRIPMYWKNVTFDPVAGQPAEHVEHRFDFGHSKVVQRQPGNDHVEGRIRLQILDPRAVDRSPPVEDAKIRIIAEPVAETSHEVFVDLDQIEPVGRIHGTNDVARDRAGARTDLEDSPRPAVGLVAYEMGQRLGEPLTAGAQGPPSCGSCGGIPGKTVGNRQGGWT